MAKLKVKKKVRARTTKGTFKADNPDTPDVNEAWREKSLAELAREHGVDYSLLYSRVRNGWDLEKALTTPVQTRKKSVKKDPPAPKVEENTGTKTENAVPSAESIVPGYTAPGTWTQNTEPPLVTPDKDTGWIWMLTVAALVGIVVAFAHEAGFL